MTTALNMRPREKLQAKGEGSLTTAELLQILIGSGNAQVPVGRIAKKALKVLSLRGDKVTFDQLLTVKGLGPARICQIIAAFELSSRFPVQARRKVVDSVEAAREAVSIVASMASRSLSYVTLDGANRQIAQRTYALPVGEPASLVLRQLFADAISDKAEAILVGCGQEEYALVPSMTDLALARDVRSTADLLRLKIVGYFLVSGKGIYSLRKAYL